MAAKQYYNIKYPFTANNNDGLFIDLNGNRSDKVTSQILHVMLTRKRTKLRDPEFGTDLIRYIFNPSDELTWGDVENDVAMTVSKYVNGVTIDEIKVISNTNNDGTYEVYDDNTVILDIKYSVKKGNTTENNRVLVNI